MRERQTMLVAGALAGNITAAGFRAAAYLATGSSAMAALAIHALADAIAEALALRGGQGSSAEPASLDPAGSSPWFWCAVAPILPLALGAGVALSDGIAAALAPRPLTETHLAYGVAAAGLVLHFVLWHTAKGIAGERRDTPERRLISIQSLAGLAAGGAAILGVWATETAGHAAADGLSAATVALVMTAAAARLSIIARAALLSPKGDHGSTSEPTASARKERKTPRPDRR